MHSTLNNMQSAFVSVFIKKWEKHKHILCPMEVFHLYMNGKVSEIQR